MSDAEDVGCVTWQALVTFDSLDKRNSTAQAQGCLEHSDSADISSYYNQLIAETQVSKSHILEPLSCLLLCVSSALSANNYNCPDADTVSVSVRGTRLKVKLDDIWLLHDLLFMELNRQAKIIFAFVEGGTEIFGSNNDKSAACHTELDDIGLWLRCCIRILPLLEFHTVVSQDATAALVSLFWNLCSPNLIRMALHSSQPNHGEIEFVMPCETSCWMHRSRESFASSTKAVKVHENHFKSGTSESHLTNIRSLVSGMIAVFVDELILHPNLGPAFANGQTESVGSFPRVKEPSLCGKHMEVSLEAVFAHCLLSLSKSNVSDTSVHKLFDWHAGYTASARISLPAAVLLLDALDLYKAPQILIAHVLVMVSESVSVDSLPTYGELPTEFELPMNISVLENAVKLYVKHLSLSNVNNDNEWVENPTLEFCLIKYGALQTELNIISDSVMNLTWDEKGYFDRHHFWSSDKGSSARPDGGHLSRLLNALCMYITEIKTSMDDLCKDVISSVLHCLVMKAFSGVCKSDSPCYAVRDVNSGTYLLGAILELMACSLSRIVHIAKEKGGSGHSTPLVQYLLQNHHDNLVYKILNFFGHRSCMQPIEIVLNNIMTKMLVRENKSVGLLLSYFAGELYAAFHMGSELLCKGYIFVMKSLMCLLVLENDGIDILRVLLESSELSVDSSDVMAKTDISQVKLHCLNSCLQVKTSLPVAMEKPPQASTLMLAKHFKKKQQRIFSDNTNQRAREDEQCIGQGSAIELPTGVVESKKACVENNIKTVFDIRGTDNFSDLTDFIVFKKGKDYSAWQQKRCQQRKRKYHREFFQRMLRRKQFLAALETNNELPHV